MPNYTILYIYVYITIPGNMENNAFVFQTIGCSDTDVDLGFRILLINIPKV